jgi:membrane associated rhomboid family serine protease
VTHFAILLLVLGAAAWYYMSADERAIARRRLLAALHEARDAVTLQGLECDAFFNALRKRNPRVIVTPLVIVLTAALTFVSWSGPSDALWHRTIAMFAHPRVLDLLISSVCLLQLGFILERLVGPLVFTAIYVATGAAAAIVGLALAPNGGVIGAPGSVLGLYGLLFVTSIWGVIRRSRFTIPLKVAKRLAVVAAVFIVYHLAMYDFGNAAFMTAFIGGLIGGIVVAREVNNGNPSMRPIAAAMAALLVIASVYSLVAVNRQGNTTTDVRPELERVIAVEYRTAGLYDEAVERFRKGRLNTQALAELIEKTIVPELQAVNAHLTALQDVAPHDQPLVATIEEFLRLRDESWRLRAAALLRSDLVALRQADSKERASLEALQKIKAATVKASPTT